MKEYRGNQTQNIAFPLGGIGTGSVSLGGNGMLVDPEINNAPNRECCFDMTNFAVKAECDGELLDSRILAGDFIKDRQGTLHNYYGENAYGIGNVDLAGLKHFENSVFKASFPIARIDFCDKNFPADVTLTAYNPFIPSNDKDSSIPAAFFDIELKNTSDKDIDYTVLFSVTNVLKYKGIGQMKSKGKITSVVMNGLSNRRNSLKYGNMTIATDAKRTAYQESWFRGDFFDKLTLFMNDLNTAGDIKNRFYKKPEECGKPDTSTVTATVNIKAGKTETLHFVLAWYVPNAQMGENKQNVEATVFNGVGKYKNYYATQFKDSFDVASYCLKNRKRLFGDTFAFSQALESSNMPASVLDAVTSNLAILKSTTVLRLEDGSFWAWEGVKRNVGSCFGTCQHVWNYDYAMPFLFPQLSKQLRSNEFKYTMEDSGLIHFRMPVNFKENDKYFMERSCVDGQMGTVIKAYREWKLSGDDEWLQQNWEKIKLLIEFAWSADNKDKWDIEKTGVISGRQHHTLDVELFGVYSWLSGFYHVALLAGAKMAEFLGDNAKKKEYLRVFKNGKKLLDKTFNGEYFVQNIDLEDKSVLESFPDARKFYWNDENSQLKYQIKEGCGIDQVLPAWHADLIGLPDIYDKNHRIKALKSIYKYNFKSMRDLNNPCRVFACNDESGTVMFSWQNGAEKPAIPIPYSEECMTGFEYAVACNMLQCGMKDEAEELVAAVRHRYDGERRNPFAELECGASYARALASYSFLLAYSGFVFDMSENKIGFKPINSGSFFWSVDGAWGKVVTDEKKYKFMVLYGNIEIKNFVTALDAISSVKVNGKDIDFTFQGGEVKVNIQISKNDVLEIND